MADPSFGEFLVPSPGPGLHGVLVFGVLRGAPADSLRHPRERPVRHHVFDRRDVDLVPPVVAEVEQIAKTAAHLQPQRIDGCLTRRTALVDFDPVRAVRRPQEVFRPLTQLELVHVFLLAVEGTEDGIVQVFQRLVAPDLDEARHAGLRLEE